MSEYLLDLQLKQQHHHQHPSWGLGICCQTVFGLAGAALFQRPEMIAVHQTGTGKGNKADSLSMRNYENLIA